MEIKLSDQDLKRINEMNVLYKKVKSGTLTKEERSRMDVLRYHIALGVGVEVEMIQEREETAQTARGLTNAR